MENERGGQKGIERERDTDREIEREHARMKRKNQAQKKMKKPLLFLNAEKKLGLIPPKK